MDNGILNTPFTPQDLFLGDNLDPEKNAHSPKLKSTIV